MGAVEEVTGVDLPEGIRGAVVTTETGRVFVVLAADNPARLAS